MILRVSALNTGEKFYKINVNSCIDYSKVEVIYHIPLIDGILKVFFTVDLKFSVLI